MRGEFQGNFLVRNGLSFPIGQLVLANGNRLISSNVYSRIREVDQDESLVGPLRKAQ